MGEVDEKSVTVVSNNQPFPVFLAIFNGLISTRFTFKFIPVSK